MTPDRSVDIHVETVRGSGQNRTKIRIRRDGGPEHVYEKLEDVPEDLRPDIEGMLEIPLENPRPPSGVRTPVSRPPGSIKRRRGEKRLELIYWWFDVIPALGGLLAAGFCGWWLRSLLLGNWRTWWILIPLLVAGCLGGLYCALAFLCNRSVIHVSQKRLSITHGPLPWPGKQRLRPSQIEQLFVRVLRGRRSRTYQVRALTSDGLEITLLPHVRSSSQALFLEREIEEYLNIDDWPVPGEQFR